MNSHSGPGGSNGSAITDAFSASPAQTLQWLPGLLSTTQILSFGGFAEYDARDKSVDLTRGFDIYSRIASNDGMKNHASFSDYGWLESEIDVRGYVPLGSSRTSLALRSRGQFKNTKGGSQIPFYDLSFLGGRDYVRGYESYRIAADRLQENRPSWRGCLCIRRFGPDMGGFPFPGRSIHRRQSGFQFQQLAFGCGGRTSVPALARLCRKT
jgi:outer membrane protein assembly factor BamA